MVQQIYFTKKNPFTNNQQNEFEEENVWVTLTEAERRYNTFYFSENYENRHSIYEDDDYWYISGAPILTNSRTWRRGIGYHFLIDAAARDNETNLINQYYQIDSNSWNLEQLMRIYQKSEKKKKTRSVKGWKIQLQQDEQCQFINKIDLRKEMLFCQSKGKWIFKKVVNHNKPKQRQPNQLMYKFISQKS